MVEYVTNPIEVIQEVGKILIWLGFFISVILVIFYYLKFRNKERSLLIEKNIDVSEIIKKRKFPGFLIGLTLLGIAIGGIVSVVVTMQAGLPLIFLIPIILLFGAIGVILGHILDKRR